jgi:hypothetical protein
MKATVSRGRSASPLRAGTSYPTDDRDASVELAFPDVPYSDAAWADPSVWTLVSPLPDGTRVVNLSKDAIRGRRHP